MKKLYSIFYPYFSVKKYIVAACIIRCTLFDRTLYVLTRIEYQNQIGREEMLI